MEIEINGTITSNDGRPISVEDFFDKFIDFIESNNWYFGGGIIPYVDDKPAICGSSNN